MTDLQKYHEDNEMHRALRRQVNQTSLANYFRNDPASMTKEVKKLISGCYAFRNWKSPDTEELVELAGALTMRLASEHGGLFWQELRTIFDRGIQKKYGEIYGLSLGTFLDWVNAYEETHDHEAMMALLYKNAEEQALKALPDRDGTTRVDVDETHAALLRNYEQYRKGVLKREQEKLQAQAGSIGAVFYAKINRNQVYRCGHPLWDGEGLDFAGARARWMNEHGFPGANLKEIFDNMIAAGITKF